MNYRAPHPSEFIPKEITTVLSDTALEAEQKGHLHPLQLGAIHRHNWLKMFVPKAYGGLELSLPEALKIEEGLSWADGSTGWVVTLCSGAAWFVGFLDPAVATEVFRNNNVVIAGSGAVTGKADVAADHYEISGYWKYASGSAHATTFTVNCVLKKDGQLLYNPDGTPMIRSFLLRKDEVTVLPTWKGMGMVATGSHSFEVKQRKLPAHRSFIIDPAHAVLTDPIYHYPFLQFAETTLAVNLSGMAVRFMDACAHIFNNKTETSRKNLMRLLSDTQITHDNCRTRFYNSVEASWNALLVKKIVPSALLREVSVTSHTLASYSREAANRLYAHCGLSAAQTDNLLNRVWRNIHTAGQHTLFDKKL